MRSSIMSRAALGVASVVLLAGCSNGEVRTSAVAENIVPQRASIAAPIPSPQGSPLPMPRRGPRQVGWLSPETKNQPLLYVADEGDGVILIFPKAGKLKPPIGEISTGIDGPWGLYVDRHHTLYVTNWYGQTVTVYPAGSTSPSATYSQQLSRPLYSIVDSKGDLFVSNANNGTVVEYQAGSTSAYRVLQTDGSEADGMDFDRQGNLYVAYRGSPSGGSSIEEFPPGATQGRSLGMAVNQPQGVVVDNNGNLLVVETGGTNRVDVFPPGQKTPSFQEPIFYTPTQLALTKSGTSLYVSTENGFVYSAGYPFPNPPALYTKEDVQSLVEGVALSDGQYR